MSRRNVLTATALGVAVAALAAIGVDRAVSISGHVSTHAASASVVRPSDRRVRPRSIHDRFEERFQAAAMGDSVGDESIGERDGFDRWFFEQRAYPLETIPEGATNVAFLSARQRNDDSDDAADVPGWGPLGPSTIPDGQTDATAAPVLSPVSGRLTAIAVHPFNPNIVYAGGAHGGVWRTNNAGAPNPVWHPLMDHEASLAVGSIAIDPRNPQIVYVGTGEPNRSCDSYFGQGVLRSENGGATWTLLGSGGSPLNNPGPFVGKSIAKIIVDPVTAGSTTSTTIWAATTIGVFTSGTIAACSTPSSTPFGLWRSKDSGQTWELQNVPTVAPGAGNFSVQDLALDPANHEILYAAVRADGVWKSTNAASGAPATFTRVGNGFAVGSATHPLRRINVGIGGTGARGTLFAAVENGAGSSLFGLYRTTDGGAHWANVDNGFNGAATLANVTVAPGPPPVLRGVLTLPGGSPITFPTDGTWNGRRLIVNNQFSFTISRVLTATSLRLTVAVPTAATGTVNWSAGNYPTYCDGQCFYDMTVAVDPTDPTGNRVYVGGNPHTFAPDLSGIPGGHTNWRSDDGGASWRAISQGDGSGGVHTDDHACAFDSNGVVYDGNDGGIWRSADRGSSWTSMNTNIAITQFQGVSTHPTNRNIVLGGTQDNGTNVLNKALVKPPAWFHSDFGDGGQSLIDQSNPARMFHTYFNQSFNFMGPAKSTNGGSSGPGTWDFVGAYFGYGPQYYNGMDPTDPVSFYAPLAKNPAFAPNVVYFGSNRVYRSPDPKPFVFTNPPAPPSAQPVSWTAVSPVLTKPDAKGNVTGAFVSWIGVLPRLVKGKEVLYTGASDGRVAMSKQVDGSGVASWTIVDKPPLPNRAVTGIEVVAGDPAGDTAIVTFSGFNGNTPGVPGHVFKTTDGGTTWADISGDLPDIPANAVVFDPDPKHGGLYVASDIGVFRTTDGGTHWKLISRGLPFVTVFGLERNPSTGQIVASTHGRGMFELKK